MDPLCGWCYGNVDNTMKLFNEFKGRVDFEILPGGMWSGTNARKQSAQMTNYFLKHDATIATHTGMQFGQAYIDFIKNRHDVLLNSEVPSRAIVTINKIAPEQSVPFAAEVLKARYYHGKDLNVDETYTEILTRLQIDATLFFKNFKTAEATRSTLEIFKKAAAYASSYPTMLAVKDEEIYLLEQGYATYEELKKNVTRLLQ